MTVPVTIGEEQLQSASRHPSLSYCSGQVPDRSSHHHRRILVATSGSAAVKCIRWIRRLSYETFGAISAFHVIVMATPEDIKKPDAEYIHMADQIVEISADARNSNRSVADIAISTQADAVWTGWSDDCENPELAYALHAANIQWIGPTSDVKRVLTAKSSSLTARDVDAGSGPGHLSDSHCLEQERLREFVRAHKGQRAIKRILIANNGIAAKKFLMSVRSWAYAAFGDSSMIQFVVMVTPEDLAAQADYIRLADRQVHVPGGSNHNNYANVDVITSIATSYHADAVWAGWGHASENPILADALAALNIAWIGPPSHAMRALGDKVASTLIAQCAGVHCVPWSGSGLDMKFKCGEEIDPELYKRACAQTEGDALRFAQQIGFPIMIKASAGGGGKGIRKCLKLSEVSAAFRQVQAEVPNSPIFLMRLVSNVRHVEVQLLADSQGNTIALYGRDCSIQRRHQKIIEEGPVVAVPPSIWSQMEKCAIRLAKAVGYVGAGTVEYLYDEANQEYAFLELNPRLQVEHPVTELISGVNLPAAQLQVAMGIPLDEIPAIRKLFGDSERGEIDFDNAPMVKPSGHVIACRITAENPNKGFQPTSGQLQELKFESSPNVWGYFSIGANGAVHDYADSQFGHVFAVGSSREDARRHMVSALKSMSYRGEISTTMEYLQAILETADYKNNSITTEWLESQSQTTAAAPQLSEKASVLLPAALFAWSSFSKSRAELEAKFERGLLTDCSDCVSICTQDIVLRRNGFKYSIKSSLVGPDSLILTIRSVRYGPIKVTELTGANNVVLNFEGRSFHVFSHSNNQLRVSIDGLTVTFEDEIELDLIRSEFSGKLLRFVQETGSHLNEGEVVAEIECMKMHMTLTMPANGRVELLKSPPCDISPREVLVRIDLDDPSVAQKATFSEFDGKFDVEFAPDNVTAFRKAELTLQNCLKGYAVDFECARDAIQTLLSEARNPATALEVLRETVTSFYGRVQPAIISEMFAVINKCSSSSSPRIKSAPVLPINDLVVLLNGHSALQKQLLNFSRSASSLVVSVIQSLFEQYTEIEEKFAGQDVAFTLKKMSSWLPPGSSTQYLMAHSAMLTTSSVIMHLLNVASIKLGSCAAELLPSIQRLTAIPQIARVARKAVFNIRRDRILNGDDSDSHNYVIREQMKLSRKLQTVIESPLKAEALIEVLSEISPQALNDDVVIGKLPSSSVLSGLLVAVYRESLQDLAIDLPKITSHSADTFYFLLQSDLVLSGCDDKLSSQLLDFVRQFDAQFLSSRPTTFGFIDTEDLSLHLFTFLTSNGHYSERQQLRNLAPSAISLLELERVSDEWISHSILPSIGVFTASLGKDGSRAFIRGMLPFLQEINDTNALLHVESKFDSVIHALVEHDLCPKCHHNNLFLNVIVPSIWGDVNGPIEAVIRKYAKELDRAHITSVEVRVQKQFCSVAPVARLVFTNIIGVGIVTDRYRERGSNPPTYQAISPSILSITDDHSATVPIGLNKRPNPLDGRVCNERYELPSKLDLRRDAARDLETLLPYDFLVLFSYLLQKQNPLIEHPFVSIELCRIEDAENWPRHEFDCSELNSLGLCAVVRPPGSNTISMVGWLCHVYCRSSQIYRDVVIVANDITIMRGSFGVDESDVFKRLSAYARHRRIPRLYLAANSGARIDIAADIDSIFQVDWVDPNDPSKGFNYLYLDEDDYNQNSDAVDAELIQTADGSRRYRINAVIGSHRSIGVENLAGSGRIAGETSLAYDSVFTLSYVSCRSVGIGAYLVRLGHRVIQKASDHAYLLLTGYGALNQLLGNKVYKSNMQLGGVDLMSGNGVSNQVVRNDLEGVRRMIEWLDFVPFDPAQKRHTVTTESPARPMPSTLDFVKNPYDPVMLIDGTDDIPGLFDKGSWVEINENWAKTIRCGHARLSGLSVGVIAVETRTQTKLIPADPVTSGSKDEVRVQPGCVLFPDSAYKMAQAINDFNRERLPTVILANWRGFSGGQRDMNDEILKFGSMIVDALVQAKMPVIVYLPPNAELRGGAWVVTDRNINRNVMEMYADPTSRGGILEPAGTVEIKYRNRKLDTLAARLNPEISPEHRQKIRSAYRNVAQHFVDLHDRPQRMAAVGIIDGVLPWAESRRFLYWRLRRLLLEHDLLRCCSRQALLHGLSQESDPGVCITDIALLREFMASVAVREDTEGIAFNEHCQDDTVVSWINAHEQALRNTLQRHERQIMLKRYLIDPEQCVPVAGQIDL